MATRLTRRTLARIGFSLAIGLIGGPRARATAQQPDWIRIDGKDYSLFTNPLTPYLEEHPDALPEPTVMSTDLWRGYVAKWEVRNQQLILSAIEMPQARKEPINVIDQVFPARDTVVADWYTGYLIVPTGKLVHYTHMGYASIYKKYIRLRIRQGVIEEQARLTKDEYLDFMRSQFEKFRRTPQGREMILRADVEEEFVFQYASEIYTSTIFEESSTTK